MIKDKTSATKKIMELLWDDTHTIELNSEKYFYDYQVMECVDKIFKEREHTHQISLECARKCHVSTLNEKKSYLKALSDILKWLEQRRDRLLCAPPKEYVTANIQIKELDILKANIKQFERYLTSDSAYEALNELNPPYSNPKPWVKKAIEESKKGKRIVMLLNVDPSTEWFSLLNEANAHFLWFAERLKFLEYGKEKGANNKPNMLVLLSNEYVPQPLSELNSHKNKNQNIGNSKTERITGSYDESPSCSSGILMSNDHEGGQQEGVIQNKEEIIDGCLNCKQSFRDDELILKCSLGKTTTASKSRECFEYGIQNEYVPFPKDRKDFDGKEDFSLVEIKNGKPYCKKHGAMNKMNKEVWRCLSEYGRDEPKEGETVGKFRDRVCNACCVEDLETEPTLDDEIKKEIDKNYEEQ